MPVYGYVFLISICKLDVICINSGSRHVIITQNVDDKPIYTEELKMNTLVWLIRILF